MLLSVGALYRFRVLSLVLIERARPLRVNSILSVMKVEIHRRGAEFAEGAQRLARLNLGFEITNVQASMLPPRPLRLCVE